MSAIDKITYSKPNSADERSAIVLLPPEELLTLKGAAEKLNLPVFKITRAAKAGVFPTYSLYNARKLVRLSEVIAAIEASRQGGFRGQR